MLISVVKDLERYLFYKSYESIINNLIFHISIKKIILDFLTNIFRTLVNIFQNFITKSITGLSKFFKPDLFMPKAPKKKKIIQKFFKHNNNSQQSEKDLMEVMDLKI